MNIFSFFLGRSSFFCDICDQKRINNKQLLLSYVSIINVIPLPNIATASRWEGSQKGRNDSINNKDVIYF